jgi:FMN reductase
MTAGNPGPPGPLLVVGLAGSARAGSYTRCAVAIALEGAAAAGARTDLLDLAELQLPFCDERADASSYPPDAHRLRRVIGSAHGIILGSPEYHGSLAGSLKNAIDLMGSEEFAGKLVGLVGVAGGSQGAAGALAHMRTVCRSLHAWVVPQQVSIPKAENAFGPDGRPTEPDQAERLLEVGREVARVARLHFQL